MYRRAVALICFSLFTCAAHAQTTPSPTVTAESEAWYLNGEPILHDGIVYYPRGATVFFDRDEFVRSGFYRGIPLYARTTVEPFSMVFVPLAGGVLQPYERPRTGEIVGTVGSFSPTLPTPVATEERRYRGMAQAAGPPTGLPGPVDVDGNPRTAGSPAAAAIDEGPRPVGTSGRVVVLPRPRPLITAARPTGANGVFVEFENARWFSAGAPVEFDAAAFRQVLALTLIRNPSDGSPRILPVTK